MNHWCGLVTRAPEKQFSVIDPYMTLRQRFEFWPHIEGETPPKKKVYDSHCAALQLHILAFIGLFNIGFGVREGKVKAKVR